MIGYTICRTGFPVGLAAMGRQFHWTAFEAGVLATIFLLGQALVDIPAGYWVDRFDRKLVIFVGLFGIGLFTILVTFSTGFWSAFIDPVSSLACWRAATTSPSSRWPGRSCLGTGRSSMG